MKRLKLAIGLALLTACYLGQFTVAVATRKGEPTKFTVRVENICNPAGNDGFERRDRSVYVITRHVRVDRQECAAVYGR
jgi:hypothetical protein